MDPVTTATLGILLMFVFILLHMPIGISMAAVGIIGFGLLSGFEPALTVLSSEAANALSSVDLAVIPLFLLMGNFATSAGLSSEIYGLAYAFMGHRRGGLALSTIFGCGFFGAICGSSPATAATFGRVAFPEMISRKYDPSFAAGCIAAGGTLGSLVPPSVILIIYAIMAEEYILDLFLAAVIPAILSIVLYFIAIMIYVRLFPNAGPAGEKIDWKNRLKNLYNSKGAASILLVVVGGIYGGIFTVNEAAAVGALLTFIFTIVRRKMTMKIFWESLTGTAVTTAMIYVVIIGANVFSYFMAVTQMPDVVVSGLSGLNLPHFMIVLMLLIIYLILGSLFDTVAAMLITLPFVLPLITNLGYHPIWWGIVNVVIIEIGMITPPIGMNVFVLHGVLKNISLKEIYHGILPFLMADIIRLLLLVLFPILILWLPNMAK